jgi:hypothetical protein
LDLPQHFGIAPRVRPRPVLVRKQRVSLGLDDSHVRTPPEILSYQERTMNAMLCHQWIGFRSEREAFKIALLRLREILRGMI